MRARRIVLISAAAVAGVGVIAAVPAIASLSNNSETTVAAASWTAGHGNGVASGNATAGAGNGKGAGNQGTANQGTQGSGNQGTNQGSRNQGSGDCLLGYESGTLTDAQADAVLFMIEEEKLAHDVYVTLGDVYEDQPVFTRIANSESQHLSTMRAIAERYDLNDQSSDVVGEFVNPELQAMYDRLVADGRESLTAALEVGQAIELDDISRIDEADNNLNAPDLQHAYDQLVSASERHLVSFGG